MASSIPLESRMTLVGGTFLALILFFSFSALYRTAAIIRAGSVQKEKLHRQPKVTIQLPICNEGNVITRLLEAVCAIDYPQEKMEIQRAL